MMPAKLPCRNIVSSSVFSFRQLISNAYETAAMKPQEGARNLHYANGSGGRDLGGKIADVFVI